MMWPDGKDKIITGVVVGVVVAAVSWGHDYIQSKTDQLDSAPTKDWMLDHFALKADVQTMRASIDANSKDIGNSQDSIKFWAGRVRRNTGILNRVCQKLEMPCSSLNADWTRRGQAIPAIWITPGTPVPIPGYALIRAIAIHDKRRSG